jgi:hypothetical protein
MTIHRFLQHVALIVVTITIQSAIAQNNQPFVPVEGQPGKDAIWVPTPPEMVEAMLDLAKVTPKDFVMDLGSGDGRNIIAAARRGTAGLGVEYDANLVELSRRLAAEAGVADRASFVEGDMYMADISKASVLALFLLPDNMKKLLPKFLDLAPGSRIVSNTFAIPDWTPDETARLSDCERWCDALLWIVPAKVAGMWRLGQSVLTLGQEFQMLSGTLDGTAISNGRLRGNEISFQVGGVQYQGRVNGNTVEVVVNGTRGTATRIKP